MILVPLAIFAIVLVVLYLRWQPQETFFTSEVCPKCHHAVQAGYLICPVCLQPLRHACTSCGRPIEVNWTVCPFCGRSVEPGEQPKELNSYKLSEL
ncbi:MAG: zinc ribbon domain-containing protein [Chloroflexota bacterium]